jgi:uncharacterized protein (TIGR02231 family)
MKILAVLLVSTVIYAHGQEPVTIQCRPEEVTVYLSGAEIRSAENIPLKKGKTVVRLEGLSPSMIDNSFQVTIGDGVEVISISKQLHQLQAADISIKVRVLRDSMANLEDRIVNLTNQLDAFETEKKMLQQNMDLGGLQASASFTDLGKAADFFRTRTLKINQEMTALTKRLKGLTGKLESVKSAIGQETGSLNLSRYAVTIIVNSPREQSAEFKLRYLVHDASWEAAYDIVARDVNTPVNLRYNAQVYNDSDIEWSNVRLTLSTGDISMGATRPFLATWVLNYSSKGNEGYLNTGFQNSNKVDSVSIAGQEVGVSELNTVFNIDQQHSILADGFPYRIRLQERELKASFQYLVIPKIEASAFLIAKVTGWESLNLIDGLANVYYANTFVGESQISTRLIGDTLELSLGRDNQIIVSRSKVEDKGKTSMMGNKRSESFLYEIQLRNNRNVPVSVRIQDQVPISQEKDITVDIDDISSAALDGPSGRLQWVKTFNAGEVVRYRIAFTVKYPKNSSVSIRQNRIVRTPRYKN